MTVVDIFAPVGRAITFLLDGVGPIFWFVLVLAYMVLTFHNLLKAIVAVQKDVHRLGRMIEALRKDTAP